ncbi:MAG TPA: 50S ribosomal protein L11 methyltransferase [Micromonosporaceae bacterium]|nr:50S ribosomal protein L11 methyltransferase [Micromonosporaceae bacterium]
MSETSAALVSAATRVAAVPYLPEIRLHQADPGADLWFLTGGAYRSDSRPPFWAFAWAGGRALARYVLDHPELVAGRSVLDLAAGSGIVGIAAARAGAASVLAVDVDPTAVAAIGLNAAANGVRVTAMVADPLAAGAPLADVLLAGDVFYSAAMAQRMSALLRRVARNGVHVLVGDADRGYLPQRLFRALDVVSVPTPLALEGRTERSATIWEVPAGRVAQGP